MKWLNLLIEGLSENRAPVGEEQREGIDNGRHLDEDSTPSLSQVTISSDSGSYEVTLQNLEILECEISIQTRRMICPCRNYPTCRNYIK